ncbi:MAG: hypothetical protein MUE47_05610 [Acidobacteria bacterium]|jgi:hypothetical protein|nr:hypothetical protein [Acidobacteriota bacterium]
MGPGTAFTVGALAAGAAIYGLHRLALWLERKGHIYYLHSKPSGSALGNAALAVQAILEPDRQYVLEERQAEKTEQRESGDPPGPDDPPEPSGPPEPGDPPDAAARRTRH